MEKQQTKISQQQINQLAQFQRGLGIQSENVSVDTLPIIKAIKLLVCDQNEVNKKYAYLEYEFENTNDKPFQLRKMIGSFLVCFESEKVWWIRSAYTLKQYRGQGVFSRMFNRMQNDARQKNIEKLKLYTGKTNYKAKKLYQKLGFKYTNQVFLCHQVTQHQFISKQLRGSQQDKNMTCLQSIVQTSQEFVQILKNSDNTYQYHKKIAIIDIKSEHKRVLGKCSYYYQFSDWGCATILNITSLSICQQICQKLHKKQICLISLINAIYRYSNQYIFNDIGLQIKQIRLVGERTQNFDSNIQITKYLPKQTFYEEDYHILQKMIIK